MGETYYEVLGVDPDATPAEIKSAYRDRVLETHPDHNDAPDAAEQFKRVSTAESVLTDGDERARYDRLGHDAYVRLGQRTAGSNNSSSSGDASSSDSNANDTSSRTDSSQSSDHRQSGTAGTSSTGSRTSSSRTGRTSTDGTRGRSATGRTRDRSGSGRTRAGGRAKTGTGTKASADSSSQNGGRSGSHHAHQRQRRRRRAAQRQASGEWPFDTDFGQSTGPKAGAKAAGSADSEESRSQYTVHGWDDEIDLEFDGQPVDHAAALTIGCIWLLYPVLVASSLTATFPLAVNAIVALCTLGLVGYLLIRPRIGAGVFGFWSLGFPVGILWTGVVAPFSLLGLFALAFAWVPFGYALALWWALRP